MAVIETEGLCKTYDGDEVAVTALKGVSFQVESGEFLAIVGPSGSGKTTLLNLLGGLDTPSAGRSVIAGKDTTAMTPAERIRFRLYNIGFVFQSFNLIPVFTAVENVEFILLLQNCGKRERRGKALEFLAAVGLADKAGRRPGQLSGGEQQRVTVARALAADPKFVLADEATANLDSATASNLLDLMGRLNQERGTTFIFSTHDPRVVERARRVIRLEDGLIVSDEARPQGASAFAHARG
jgi:putative ABC transport system ATP-binding protein